MTVEIFILRNGDWSGAPYIYATIVDKNQRYISQSRDSVLPYFNPV